MMALVLLATPAALSGQDSASTAPLPSIDLPAQLSRVLRDYETAWQRHDPAGLSRLFATDGFVLQSGRQPVRGRPAIAQIYAKAGGDLWLRALGYRTADSVGYIIGAYGYGKAPPVPDVGKFVLALRRGPDGQWLIMADIDNGNRRE
jgi:ketosteroid isomerase-like protein